ncbi:MAG: MBL fold metallo-hydrolase [Sphingobacteriales bacterium]|nr:MAG: MBL fold metallo-hydrolase [Sphingobacteriales bacterium]
MKEQLSHQKEVHTLYFDVAPYIWGTKDVFVNMYIVQDPASKEWVLIDTGLKSSAVKIKKMAAQLFGEDSRPSAILLTHGHFDHVGSLKKLADEWDVSIYCHYLELPYLSGRSSYPPADPRVGGGLMAKVSGMYPKRPIDVESRLHILPPDGSVPFLPGWRYVNSPGHSPGHVSYFRERDKVMIVGDAFVTTKQESVTSVMLQIKKLSGPPKYFTYDWEAAGVSVKNLAALNPNIVATGHGRPMSGTDMQVALANLAAHFDKMAIPARGRYVNDPAVTNATGVVYVPPKLKDNTLLVLAIGAGVAAAGLAWMYYRKYQKKKQRSITELAQAYLLAKIKEAL